MQRKCESRPRGVDGYNELDEKRGKGIGKGNGGKREHGSQRGLGSKGAVQDGRQHEEDERVQVAPNMVAHTPSQSWIRRKLKSKRKR